MIRLVILLAVLLLAVILGMTWGTEFIQNRGYVLITRNDWKIEMNILSFALVVLAFYFITWFVFRVIGTLLAMGNWSLGYWQSKGVKKQENALTQGLQAYSVGQYDVAEKCLSSIEPSRFGGAHLLLLSDIAHKNNDSQKQSDILSKAEALATTRNSALVVKAKQAMDIADFVTARQCLTQLPEKEQRSPLVIQTLAQSYALAGEWKQLQANLPTWKKSLSKSQYIELEKQAELGRYAELASKEGINELIAVWESAGRKVKKSVVHQLAFVQQLLDQGMHEQAQTYLVTWQPKQPVPQLLPMFAKLKLKNPNAALAKLEDWLKQTPESVELLSVLAKVAFTAEDYDLSEKVINKILQLNPHAPESLLLAQIKERQKNTDMALTLYKRQLEIN